MTLEKKKSNYERSTSNISNIVSSIMTWLKFNGSPKEVEIFQVFNMIAIEQSIPVYNKIMVSI